MSEQKFKVGDRVRWTLDDYPDEGVVTDITSGYLHVTWDRMGKDIIHPTNQCLRLASETSDPISPNHYKFPGGAEVIQISEHLTSNGGQALQYIARATRLDGNIKGNPIEDLKKAIFFSQREIDRLEAAE